MPIITHVGNEKNILIVVVLFVLFGFFGARAIFMVSDDVDMLQQNEQNFLDIVAENNLIIEKNIAGCQMGDITSCTALEADVLPYCDEFSEDEIPDCYNGRIEQVLSDNNPLSEECQIKLSDIQNMEKKWITNPDERSYRDAIYDFESLCGDYYK
jgi:hypothetical protein